MDACSNCCVSLCARDSYLVCVTWPGPPPLLNNLLVGISVLRAASGVTGDAAMKESITDCSVAVVKAVALGSPDGVVLARVIGAVTNLLRGCNFPADIHEGDNGACVRACVRACVAVSCCTLSALLCE